jgi:hypothetical protein
VVGPLGASREGLGLVGPRDASRDRAGVWLELLGLLERGWGSG